MVDGKKYQCQLCSKGFEVVSLHNPQDIVCPRCGAAEIIENVVCQPEAGPPDWEFRCKGCKGIFRIESPRGPEEVKTTRCPMCQDKDVVWMISATEACGSGG